MNTVKRGYSLSCLHREILRHCNISKLIEDAQVKSEVGFNHTISLPLALNYTNCLINLISNRDSYNWKKIGVCSKIE